MPAPFTGPEGPHGEHLELQTSLSWPKNFSPSPAFIHALLSRMRACAHRSPDLLPIYGISRASLSNLTAAAKCLLSNEGNVLFAPIPPHSTLHVIGDIHGDVFSLLSALSITGLPSPDNKLVFAGDFVDRGAWGCETLVCVFALKCAFPDYVFLIRGNHETTYCTQTFGFETECSRKYGPGTYKNFLSAFRHLPLATVTQSLLPAPKARKEQKRKNASPPAKRTRASSAFPWDEELQVGERRVLVVHGGLWRAFETAGSMALGTVTQIAKMPHPGDDPKECAASDVLWSDPTCTDGGKGVRKNSLRGEGVLFGFGAVDAFLKANKLCAMVRSSLFSVYISWFANACARI